jgi:hypothetical protein
MTTPTFAALVLLVAISVTGCAPRHRYYDPYGHRTEHRMTDHDAWEIVRRDPCRYEEYRRFAENHKNPEKRREVVWRLAHEGCKRERAYDYQYDDR